MNYNGNINKIKGNMKTNNLPNLNETVLSALDFFNKNKPPQLKLNKSAAYIAAGSAGASHACRLIFMKANCFFGDESNFKNILKTYKPFINNKTIKEAYIVSSSGEKDSLWQIKAAQRAGLKTTLLTCRGDSRGAKLADQSIVFGKIPEPYSYNSSTYLGMCLSVTKEDPAIIKGFIKKIKIPKNFKRYSFFTFILPDDYKPVVDMINTKDDEIFGPYSSLRAYTEGEARHAKFICQSAKELVISFVPNYYFGLKSNRWTIKLPKIANTGLILSLSYYLVGLIQKQKPAYFKKGIEEYCLKTGPKPYGQKTPFSVMVK